MFLKKLQNSQEHNSTAVSFRFPNKVAGWRLATLLKNNTGFPLSFAKCSRIFFLQSSSGRQLKVSVKSPKELFFLPFRLKWLVIGQRVTVIWDTAKSQVLGSKINSVSDTWWNFVLAFFMPLISFCTPWKHQKTENQLMHFDVSTSFVFYEEFAKLRAFQAFADYAPLCLKHLTCLRALLMRLNYVSYLRAFKCNKISY